jgi:hypothetical protein
MDFRNDSSVDYETLSKPAKSRTQVILDLRQRLEVLPRKLFSEDDQWYLDQLEYGSPGEELLEKIEERISRAENLRQAQEFMMGL